MIISTTILGYWIAVSANLDYASSILYYALPTSLFLYIGARFDLIKLTLSPPSWTRGFFASLIVFIIFLFIINPSLLYHFGFPFGIFINISYLGAKISCMNLGCCGIRSIKDRYFFGWRLRPRLQSFEVVMSIIILLTGILLYFVNASGFSAITLLAGHATLRIFAATFRFPYKSIGTFLKEPSGGGIIIVGIIAFFLDVF